MDLSPDMERRFKDAVVVGFSLFLSLGVLLAAEELIRWKLRPFFGFAGGHSGRSVRYIFFAAAALVILVIKTMRKRALRMRPEEDKARFASRLAWMTLSIMALAVVPALLGFVLFLLFGLNIDYYILMFVSLFLVFMFFPRRSSWVDTISFQ